MFKCLVGVKMYGNNPNKLNRRIIFINLMKIIRLMNKFFFVNNLNSINMNLLISIHIMLIREIMNQ